MPDKFWSLIWKKKKSCSTCIRLQELDSQILPQSGRLVTWYEKQGLTLRYHFQMKGIVSVAILLQNHLAVLVQFILVSIFLL